MNRRKSPERRPRSARRPITIVLGGVMALALSMLSPGSSRVGAQVSDPCAPPNGNPIVCENQKGGAPASEWDVNGAGDTTIQGFSTDISVNRGQTISFKIN